MPELNSVFDSASTILGGVVTLAFLVWIAAYFRQVDQAIERATLELAEQLRTALKALELGSGPDGFARGFVDIDTRFRGLPRLSEAWHEFTEGLVRPADSEEVAYRNSRPAAWFFTAERLLAGGMSAEVAAAKAGRFVGIGILGTFVGLTIGIFFAFTSMQAPDVEEVRAGLTDLLSGSAVAFITSVFGLAASMRLEAVQQRSYGTLFALVTRLQVELDARVELLTAEQLAQDQLEELRAQTTQLKAFNTDLALSIAEALDDRIAKRLTPSLDKLIAAVDKLRVDRQDSNEQLLQTMIGDFRETLSGATGDEATRLQATLASLEGSLSGLAEALPAARSDLVGVLSDAGDRVRVTLDGGAQAAARVLQEQLASAGSDTRDQLLQGAAALQRVLTEHASPVANSLEASASKVEAAALRFDTGATRFGSAAQAMGRASDALAGSVDTLSSVEDGLRDGVGTLSSSATQLSEATRALIANSTAQVRAATEIRQAAGAVQDALDKSRKVWADYAARFESADENMAVAFEGYQRGVEAHAVQVSTFLNGMEQHLAKSLEGLSQAIPAAQEGLVRALAGANQEVRETLGAGAQTAVAILKDQLADAGRDTRTQLVAGAAQIERVLADAARPIAASLENSATKMESASGRMETGAARFEVAATTMSTTAVALDGSSSALANAGEGIQAGISTLRQSTEVLARASDGLANQSSRQAQAATEIMAASLALQRAVAASQAAWADYAGRFEQVDQSMATAFGGFQDGVDRYTRSVHDFFGGIDQHLSQSVSALSGVAAELSAAAEALAEANGAKP